LHQLAVVATDMKPPRLSDARNLLLHALRLEDQCSVIPSAARAATLQQLGRVEIRSGELDEAEVSKLECHAFC
jgi:hypothetical protein